MLTEARGNRLIWEARHGSNFIQAVIDGDRSRARTLLKEPGANINYQGLALPEAIINGNMAMVQLLLEHNDIDINASIKGKSIESAIKKAANRRNLTAVGKLLQLQNARKKYSVLIWAAAYNHKNIVRLLVEHGANRLEEAAQVARERGYKAVAIYLEAEYFRQTTEVLEEHFEGPLEIITLTARFVSPHSEREERRMLRSHFNFFKKSVKTEDSTDCSLTGETPLTLPSSASPGG